jgi:hypothetical protein
MGRPTRASLTTLRFRFLCTHHLSFHSFFFWSGSLRLLSLAFSPCGGPIISLQQSSPLQKFWEKRTIRN